MHEHHRLLVVVACVAASIVAHEIHTWPGSLDGFADEEVGSEIPWDGRAIAVPFLRSLAYNASRDATLAVANACDLRSCGPLVWVAGTVASDDPVLLQPTADVLHVGLADPTKPPTSAAPRTRESDINVVLLEMFEATSPLPPAAWAWVAMMLPLIALALVPAPRGTTTQRPGDQWIHRLAGPGGVAAGSLLALVLTGRGLVLVLYAGVATILIIVATVTFVAFLIKDRRVPQVPLAMIIVGLTYLLTLGVLLDYFPTADGGV